MPAGPAILDLGCGRNKKPGAVGLDSVALPGVDVVHDLNRFPYPFPDRSFDEIHLTHVIEHVESILKVMEEVHRIGKPHCLVTIITPHHSDAISWQDPTHRWHLNSYSFVYFDPHYESNYYTKARFRLLEGHLELARIWKLLGLQALINLDNRFRSLRFIRRLWEEHLCYMMRGKQMTFVLEVLK